MKTENLSPFSSLIYITGTVFIYFCVLNAVSKNVEEKIDFS